MWVDENDSHFSYCDICGNKREIGSERAGWRCGKIPGYNLPDYERLHICPKCVVTNSKRCKDILSTK